MIDLSFSIYDLEYFLLILVRISCFVFIAPFFSMSNTPSRVRVALSIFISILLYQVLTPVEYELFDTELEYAMLVIKEAIAGLLIGFGSNICMAILNFAGTIADMETGLSMVTLMDPNTRQQTSFTGVLYQYAFTMMLIASGMYRYLLGAIADSFVLIPVGGAVFRSEAMLATIVSFLSDYVVLGFRIVLPIFCVILLLNAVLGIMAKVSPQMNMFAVGMQLKVLVGLGVLFLTTYMMPGASEFIFEEMKTVTVSFVEAIRP
ncbi:MAG: flagellar biosynthetic protein FliR [Lachnospiraceae bacterium]|nr:flagellar biosynthetic protein FliR [Lachnospiraceae bacterium]